MVDIIYKSIIIDLFIIKHLIYLFYDKSKYTNFNLVITKFLKYINTLGVMQAINKFGDFFTKDDEGLIKIISLLARISLTNALFYNQKTLYDHNFKSLI